MNILICDDADDAALALKKIIAFSVSDVNITVFNAGEDALAYIRSGKKPDLRFLDILMPGMDGISLAANMRKEGYSGSIPINRRQRGSNSRRLFGNCPQTARGQAFCPMPPLLRGEYGRHFRHTGQCGGYVLREKRPNIQKLF